MFDQACGHSHINTTQQLSLTRDLLFGNDTVHIGNDELSVPSVSLHEVNRYAAWFLEFLGSNDNSAQPSAIVVTTPQASLQTTDNEVLFFLLNANATVDV